MLIGVVVSLIVEIVFHFVDKRVPKTTLLSWSFKNNTYPKQIRKLLYVHINAMENNLINKGRSGSFFKYVNSKTSTRSGVAPLKYEFGNFINDSSKAEVLNIYFSSVLMTMV